MAANLRSPYLLSVRDTVAWLWITVGLIGLTLIYFRRKRPFGSLRPFHLLTIAAVLGGIIAGHGHWRHARNRNAVLSAPSDRIPELGKHLVIGWLGYQETRDLAAKGAIAGVFLTKRDFKAGSSVSEIRHIVDELQRARREARLPPLWIATDQEGGSVERLTPPLPDQEGLGLILRDLDGPGIQQDPERAAEIVRRVTVFAEIQGSALAEAGINMNFAPVVDIRPKNQPDKLDIHTRIASRALAEDPDVIALAGETYVRVLAKHGITAVLKHFPGLGRVPSDTHHFSASLSTEVRELEASDWVPFREITNRTRAGIMLGHVHLTALDPDQPASCSGIVIREYLREEWNVKGLLVTDDFSMTPIFHGPGGIVGATRKSIAAGVDLILLSYDAEAAYDLLAAGMEDPFEK
ncbi:MAG: hypothetical protein NWQ16_00950 [Akkermansiaceae bacterium]|nr:hypothetical protein [Akkermansiaceae bacterium]